MVVPLVLALPVVAKWSKAAKSGVRLSAKEHFEGKTGFGCIKNRIYLV